MFLKHEGSCHKLVSCMKLRREKQAQPACDSLHHPAQTADLKNNFRNILFVLEKKKKQTRVTNFSLGSSTVHKHKKDLLPAPLLPSAAPTQGFSVLQ